MNAVVQTESNPATTPERCPCQNPSVDIFETKDAYVIEADMPGVTKEGVEISLDQNELTLVGRRPVAGSGTRHYRESGEGHFRRVFELHPEIDTDRITAKVENGVLTLHLAKREEVKPRRIAIND